jgi:hypothetical protein
MHATAWRRQEASYNNEAVILSKAKDLQLFFAKLIFNRAQIGAYSAQ